MLNYRSIIFVLLSIFFTTLFAEEPIDRKVVVVVERLECSDEALKCYEKKHKPIAKKLAGQLGEKSALYRHLMFHYFHFLLLRLARIFAVETWLPSRGFVVAGVLVSDSDANVCISTNPSDPPFNVAVLHTTRQTSRRSVDSNPSLSPRCVLKTDFSVH